MDDARASETRRALGQALAIGALSVLVAAAVHWGLIKRFIEGEFRQAFFSQTEYPGLRLIGLQEAEDQWAAGVAVFLDARAADVFAGGHVPGARNIPAAASELEIAAEILELPPLGTLVVYCEGGDCQSSLMVARRLHDQGFRDIRVMTGGWAEWAKAGLPQETGR